MMIEVPGGLLHSPSFGPGPARLLALSGWSASWQLWLPTFERLADSARVIGYDTRGTGSSTTTLEELTFANLVDDVFRVLDAHGVERCVLAGESLGGFVALHAAARQPERFSHLVVVGAPPLVHLDFVRHLVDGVRVDMPTTIADFVQTCLTEPDAAALAHWGEHLFVGTSSEVSARLFEVADAQPLDLTTITVPTTVIHGRDDRIVPIDFGRMIADSVPDARFVEIADAGHVPVATRPAVVADVIRPLLG